MSPRNPANSSVQTLGALPRGALLPERTAHDLVIVGGCGRVGLPLALVLADRGLAVGIYDINSIAVASVLGGRVPFSEPGCDELLRKVLRTNRLAVTDDISIVERSEALLLTIGTPVDEFMNPTLRGMDTMVDEVLVRSRQHSLVILRSTAFPGTVEYIQRRIRDLGGCIDVAYCPERLAEGHALEELVSLPQIIGAHDPRVAERAAAIFAHLGVEIILGTPREAEFAKLLDNTWRYLKFAAANYFLETAHAAGIDYEQALYLARHNYWRAKDLPNPGFAAGPCLVKDAAQFAAMSGKQLSLSTVAIQVNEGVPNYIVETLSRGRTLAGLKVGILGMAFKAESDDGRASLAYKLKKLLIFHGAEVLTTDPYVNDSSLVELDEVLAKSEVLVVGTPHSAYRCLDLSGRQIVDIWGATGAGIQL